MKEIRDLVDILVFPTHNETSENKISKVSNNLNQLANHNHRNRVKRFDPQTGELINPESTIPTQFISKEKHHLQIKIKLHKRSI